MLERKLVNDTEIAQGSLLKKPLNELIKTDVIYKVIIDLNINSVRISVVELVAPVMASVIMRRLH